MSEAAIEAEVIESTAVVPAEERAPIVRADAGDVLAAFGDYQKIQAALDKAMPDCIMTIGKKKFRKKSYWRAIATAFNLDVEPTDERREDAPDGDWGYCVTYRATANNGRSAIGDGACFASEKDASQRSVHNVRAHAHTRGFNRAVSNLVGFGEVSAEEMEYERPPAQRQQQAAAQQTSRGGRGPTEAQLKRMYAKSYSAAEKLQVPQDSVDAFCKRWVSDLGLESSKQLNREQYDGICERLDNLSLNDLVPPTAEGEGAGAPF